MHDGMVAVWFSQGMQSIGCRVFYEKCHIQYLVMIKGLLQQWLPKWSLLTLRSRISYVGGETQILIVMHPEGLWKLWRIWKLCP